METMTNEEIMIGLSENEKEFIDFLLSLLLTFHIFTLFKVIIFTLELFLFLFSITKFIFFLIFFVVVGFIRFTDDLILIKVFCFLFISVALFIKLLVFFLFKLCFLFLDKEEEWAFLLSEAKLKL